MLIPQFNRTCHSPEPETGGSGGEGNLIAGEFKSHAELEAAYHRTKAERDVYKKQATSRRSESSDEGKKASPPPDFTKHRKAAQEHEAIIKKRKSAEDWDDGELPDLLLKQSRLDRLAEKEADEEDKYRSKKAKEDSENEYRKKQIADDGQLMREYYGFDGSDEQIEKLIAYQSKHNIDRPLTAWLKMNRESEDAKKKKESDLKTKEDEMKNREHKTPGAPPYSKTNETEKPKHETKRERYMRMINDKKVQSHLTAIKEAR